MKVGGIFPQTEIGDDPAVIKDFAQAVESLGYDHLVIFDHVLGADASRTDRPRGPYTHDTAFHEPFVLFGYLAGLTSRIELVTGVIILPQRQTALVAKQAAEIDILSRGRLRLGVGTGWNAVEYESLNENSSNPGQAPGRTDPAHAKLCADSCRFHRQMAPHRWRRSEAPSRAANPDLVRRPR